MLPEDPFWLTITLLAMPAAGSLIGGLLAEAFTISRRTLSLALHGVAGILLAVVGIELMPVVLAAGDTWFYILMFMAGALFTLAIDWATEFTRKLLGRETPEDASRTHEPAYPCRRPGKHPVGASGASRSAAIVIFIGVAIDFVTDGLLIVSGADVSRDIAVLLGIALFAADSPEAFATIANMKAGGSSRRLRLFLTLSFPVVLIGGGLFGEWLLRGAPSVVQISVLAFTAGIILTLVESQIIPETFEKWEGKTATLTLVGSFILFGAISAYLG